MASLNKVLLIGNLTRDPELRTTPKGTAICQFGLAINRKYKDESGATKDDTTFVDVEAWGKQADLVAQYLSKGSSCFIEGRLRLDQWEDKESKQKRSRLKVVMENVQFLSSKKGPTTPDDPNLPRTTEDAPRPKETPLPATTKADEDVPF